MPRCSAINTKNFRCKNSSFKENKCRIHYTKSPKITSNNQDICEVCWDKKGSKICVCTCLLCKQCRELVEVCPYCRRSLKFLYATSQEEFILYTKKIIDKYSMVKYDTLSARFEVVCEWLDFVLCKEHTKFWNTPDSIFPQFIASQLNQFKKESKLFEETKFAFYSMLFEDIIRYDL